MRLLMVEGDWKRRDDRSGRPPSPRIVVDLAFDGDGAPD
jgi:hypothetical protein